VFVVPVTELANCFDRPSDAVVGAKPMPTRVGASVEDAAAGAKLIAELAVVVGSAELVAVILTVVFDAVVAGAV
jgi:hypothetical protein